MQPRRRAQKPGKQPGSEKAVPEQINGAQIAVHWKRIAAAAGEFCKRRRIWSIWLWRINFAKKIPGAFGTTRIAGLGQLLAHYTDTEHPPFWKWFVGGKLNICYNCVDRHLATKIKRPSFCGEPEHESPQVLTYRELCGTRERTAAMLRILPG
jgi:acetyl-CoA synthetase